MLHPLDTPIAPPEQFTYPFCYQPHPLAVQAAGQLQQYLASLHLSEGKMFGILVVASPGSASPVSFLAAYSGLLEGRNDWPYFVPPVFDAQQPDGYFKQQEREISLTSRQSPLVAKKMSQDLQVWLFRQYRFLNAFGQQRDLLSLWHDYHCSPRIRNRYPLPPGGTGDCCAPKLLNHAYSLGLRPLCMAEFWWGPSPKSEVRHHAHFYPACRGKCKPILTWMLQGLDVEPNPEEAGFPHLVPEVVYEDEALAVLNKPSGMLSIPGRTEDYSVATWAQQRWPGSLLVHRLDLWTSGLIVVAKTPEANRCLQDQFVRHTVSKCYIALLDGVPRQPSGRISLPLYSDPMNRPRQIVDYERGKTAITEYKVLSHTADTSLVALYPHTGRTHQLRVHCAHVDGLGCPIHGDELYSRAPLTMGAVASERLCLHADFLEFSHPVTGQTMTFRMPAPFGTTANNR